MTTSVCVIASSKIYKIQNPDGSVSYSDKPPKQAEAPVTEVELQGIDNRIDPTIDAKARADFLGIKDQQNFDEANRVKAKNKQLAELQKTLDNAKADLQQGKQIQAGDYIRTANGGSRLSPAYVERVKKLEQAVQAAQAAIAKLK